MGMAAAIFSGFAVAAAAPALFRVARGFTGWILATLPLALMAYFIGLMRELSPEGIVVTYAWAPSFGLNLSFRLDGLSLLMALLITGIGALILIYAGSYLSKNSHLGRLYALLLVFMASMLGVVLSDNLLALFVFWELTSISSYLLIGFDHERPAARAAALQALLVTGGGGLALLAGFLLLGHVAADVGVAAGQRMEISALFGSAAAIRDHGLYLPILILVACGALTKSAQFPFHFWLPSAMEAPTPVSAYLHSATMVKAGVYLLARFQPVLGATPEWQWLLIVVGGITMLVGALLAVQERDLKRVLAQSTVSALGMLTMFLGLGTADAAAAAVAFLLAHALYKGALFMVAGAVDHGAGTRDVRELAGLARAMPLTATAAILAALSMAAVPPLFGFLAKELLYEAALHGPAANLVIAASVAASALFVVVALVAGVRPFVGAASDRAAQAREGSVGLWLGPIVLAGLGLALGLYPRLVDGSLLEGGLLLAAQRAVWQASPLEPWYLSLWHGWNLALGLSLFTFAAGVALFFVRGMLRTLLLPVSRIGPAAAYQAALRGLIGLAALQTRLLQSGYLRYYLMITLATWFALIAYTLFFKEGLIPSLTFDDIRPHEVAIAVLIPLACFATIHAASRLSAIVALGVVGYSVALIFVLFGAPDLAMTQFLIETLTVILFVFAFYHSPTGEKFSTATARVRDGVIAVGIGGLMTVLALLGARPNHEHSISGYYVENSVPEAHGRNIVNVILVDFRALDTMGEATVLALAGVGVYALLKLRPLQGGPE